VRLIPTVAPVKAVALTSSAPKGKCKEITPIKKKWKENQENKVKVEPPTKQPGSAARLGARSAPIQRTFSAELSIASLRKNRSGFAGSLQEASKAHIARIRDTPDYLSEILKVLRPVPYK
jgi:hypothetical protein